MDEDTQVKFREEQTRLTKIIEALAKLESNKEWKIIKELVFDKSLGAIERQMLNESVAQEVDVNKIYRLQGEWAWSKQFSDIGRFADTLKKQLQEIKNKLIDN